MLLRDISADNDWRAVALPDFDAPPLEVGSLREGDTVALVSPVDVEHTVGVGVFVKEMDTEAELHWEVD